MKGLGLLRLNTKPLLATLAVATAFAGAASASAATYESAVLADDPAAYFRLDARAIASDSAGNNDGVYTDVGVDDGAIPGSRGALFRGPSTTASVASIPDSAELDMPAEFTLEARIRHDVKSNSTAGLLHKGGSGSFDDGNFHLYIDANGNLRFRAQTGSGTTYENLVGPSIPADGAWRHVALTYRAGIDPCGGAGSGRIRLFLDGALVAELQSSSPWIETGIEAEVCTVHPIDSTVVNDFPMQIGRSFAGNSFKGAIDEVAVYSTELTASSIAEHAGSPDASTSRFRLLTDEPIAYFDLDDVPGMIDRTGNGNHGSFKNYDGDFTAAGITDGPPPESNLASTFSGFSRGEVPTLSPTLNFSGDTTVEAWYRPSTNASGTRTIVTKGTNGVSGATFWMFHMNDDLYFWFKAGGIEKKLSWPTASNGTTIGDWYHVVGVFDGCEIGTCTSTLYVNGVQVATTSTSGLPQLASNTYPMNIGRAGSASGGTGTAGNAGAAIDEVAIYDFAMSQPTVASHYALRRFGI